MKIAIKILWIAAAVTLIAVCVNMFLGPCDVAAGGVTGLSVIVEAAFGLNRAVTVFAFNALMLALAFFLLEKQVFVNMLIGALLLPAAMGLVPRYRVIDDRMLSVVIGSVLFGVAVSILYRQKASGGGTSIPPLIFKKYFRLDPSAGLLIMDGLVVALSFLAFGVEAGFYAMLSIFLTAITMRLMETGLNRKKTVWIISEQEEAILNEIRCGFDGGVTILPIAGAHEQSPTNMLMVTLDFRDYQKLVAIVDSHDSRAFMVASTVADVHGHGLTYASGSV